MQTTFTVEQAKTGKAYVFDMATLPEHVVNHAMEYGLRQIINDAASSVKVKVDGAALTGKALDKAKAEAGALSDKRYQNMLDGNLRASVGRTADPVRAAAIAEATKKVEAAIAKKGGKVKDYKSAAIRARAIAAIEADPSFMVRAQAYVDSINAAGSEIDIDLDDFAFTDADAAEILSRPELVPDSE